MDEQIFIYLVQLRHPGFEGLCEKSLEGKPVSPEVILYLLVQSLELETDGQFEAAFGSVDVLEI